MGKWKKWMNEWVHEVNKWKLFFPQLPPGGTPASRGSQASFPSRLGDVLITSSWPSKPVSDPALLCLVQINSPLEPSWIYRLMSFLNNGKPEHYSCPIPSLLSAISFWDINETYIRACHFGGAWVAQWVKCLTWSQFRSWSQGWKFKPFNGLHSGGKKNLTCLFVPISLDHPLRNSIIQSLSAIFQTVSSDLNSNRVILFLALSDLLLNPSIKLSISAIALVTLEFLFQNFCVSYKFQFSAEVFRLDFYFFEHCKYSCFIVLINISNSWSLCGCSISVVCCFSSPLLMVSYFPVCWPSSLNAWWMFILPQLPHLQTSQRNLRTKDVNSRDCHHGTSSHYYSKST